MSLVEVLVAIAVLGIIAIPMTTLFADSILTVKYTNDRIEATSVIRTIKENVTTSVKYGPADPADLTHHAENIPTSDASNPEVNLKFITDSSKTINLKIIEYIDGNPTANTEYLFDASRVRGPGSATAAHPDIAIPGCPRTVEYFITVKKMANTNYNVLNFKFLVDLDN